MPQAVAKNKSFFLRNSTFLFCGGSLIINLHLTTNLALVSWLPASLTLPFAPKNSSYFIIAAQLHNSQCVVLTDNGPLWLEQRNTVLSWLTCCVVTTAYVKIWLEMHILLLTVMCDDVAFPHIWARPSRGSVLVPLIKWRSVWSVKSEHNKKGLMLQCGHHWCVDFILFFWKWFGADFILLIYYEVVSLIFCTSFSGCSEYMIKCFGVCSHCFEKDISLTPF